MSFTTNHTSHQITATNQSLPITIDSPAGVLLPTVSTLSLTSEYSNIGYVNTSTITAIDLLTDTEGSTTSIVYNGRLHFYGSSWSAVCEHPDLPLITSHTTNAINTTADATKIRLVALEERDRLPSGSIFMWSGSSVPTNWALCNGQTSNGVVTPNLCDSFILCKKAIGDAYTSGGESGVTLELQELPEHKHIVPWGEHWETGGEWGYYGSANNYGSGGADDWDNVWRYSSTAGGDELTGDASPHNNTPKFYALAYIMYTGN